MFKKTFIATIIALSVTTAFAGGNNNGPKFGGSDSNASAGALGVGIGVGVGHAKAGAAAINSNKIGVGVQNKVGINNDVNNHNFNRNLNDNHNFNRNLNDLSNRNVNDNHNFNRNLNENTAVGGRAKQDQGQMQGQALNSKQANDQSMTYNEANGLHYSGEYKVKMAPAIGAASIPPSAGCQKPVTGGLSGTLGGVTFGTTYTDETCIMYEDIRFGMEGDEESRRLANMVIQNRLMGHLEKQDEVAAANQQVLNDYTPPAEVSVWALTDY